MKYLKLFLAVVLLACLLPLPYGFYTLVRFGSMVAFAIFAFLYYERNSKKIAVIFGSLALLFQPFIKIVLGRSVWNFVDVAVAILLVVLWFKENRK